MHKYTHYMYELFKKQSHCLILFSFTSYKRNMYKLVYGFITLNNFMNVKKKDYKLPCDYNFSSFFLLIYLYICIYFFSFRNRENQMSLLIMHVGQ